MSQSAKAQEPSMEEILASIRRIIADDETGKPPPKAAPPAAAAPPPPATVPPPQPAAAAPPAADMTQSDIDAMIARLDAPPGGENPEPESEDILELTESMAPPRTDDEVPSFQTIDGQSDVVFSDAPAEPAPRPIEEPRRQHSQNSGPDRALLSASTSAAVDSAFNALAQTVLVQNARTLEDLVREMLRPMLKSWLDDNLPNLVERIVKAEIERVSRGRG